MGWILGKKERLYPKKYPVKESSYVKYVNDPRYVIRAHETFIQMDHFSVMKCIQVLELHGWPWPKSMVIMC